MKEYRPLNPPEEKDVDEYLKCDHCEQHFITGFENSEILTLSFGKYCKSCCDNHVEISINYGFSLEQIDQDMKEFTTEYLRTFKLPYAK